jgi:hypothetical protein
MMMVVVDVVIVVVVDGDLSEHDCDKIEGNRYHPVGKH